MYPQIIFICIRNKKVKLNTDDFEPMKHFHIITLPFDSFKGRGLRPESLLGLFLLLFTRISEVFCVRISLRRDASC